MRFSREAFHASPLVPGPARADRAGRRENGSTTRQAALRFDVSPSAAIKLVRRVREGGSPAPARFGGHRRPILDQHGGLIRALLDAKPDITLVEIQAALARRGVVVRAASTVLRWLRRAGLTRKKRA